MNLISIIIKREFLAKVRNKSFIVMTFLSPLLFVGIGVFVGYLSNLKPETKFIAIHDETSLCSKEFIKLNKSDAEYHYTDLSKIPLQFLKDSVANEHYEGILYVPKVTDSKLLEEKITFISNESPSIGFIKDLQNVIEKKLTQQNQINAKLDTLAFKKAQASVNIKLSKTSGEASLKGINELKVFIGGAFGYLIMMFIIIYGNMVMRSVIEEKTNRIIEIIISSVKPFQLMIGKIIGTSLAGILQFAIWAIVGLGLFIASSLFFNTAPNPAASQALAMASNTDFNATVSLYLNEIGHFPIATILGCFVIYFVGGYFLYSSFYAAIGAAVDNETDSQQFLLPIIMPLVLGVYIGFFTVINDPHGTVATVFSMIPLTSPIVMLMRIPFGVPWWQIVVSVIILYGTFVLVVWFAAKIYRIGILMYGKKPTWKELYKWMKQQN
jgi:ABC-2 type transport system permease protein